MWDYNGDGVIDSSDDEAYWDDVYFEEHRNDYSPNVFSSSSTSQRTSQTSTDKKEAKWYEWFLTGIPAIFTYLVMFTGALFLFAFGVAFMFIFPPLGILMMWPLYKMLGGKMRLF